MPRKIRQGFVWIPRKFSWNYGVKIGSDTITRNDILDIKFNRVATGGIGEFALLLDNNAETYTDEYTGGEAVEIYLDYKDGDTLQFKGIIEKSAKVHGDMGSQYEIKGRHVSSQAYNITVTKDYTNIELSVILKELISEYLTDYTYTNVETTNVTATITWEHKPFWDCVIDLCLLANRNDCYVDNDKDFHFFAENSKHCHLEACILGPKGSNIINVSGIGNNVSEVKNKIKVYGKTTDGQDIIYTNTDATSSTSYKVRERIIKDNLVTTVAQAEERAQAELDKLKSAETEVELLTFGQPLINPGETIWVSITQFRVLSKYKIVKYEHSLGIKNSYFFTTKLYLQKEPKKFPQIFKERMEKELQSSNRVNPNDMDYTYNFDFDSDTYTVSHSNTKVSNSYLMLASGTSGTWISKDKSISDNITRVEIRATGSDLNASNFLISVDSGVSWESVTPGFYGAGGTEYAVLGTGNQIRVKVILNSDADNATPRLDNLVAYFK